MGKEYDNFLVSNTGNNPLVSFNFVVRVELVADVPCKSVRAFARELEYDLIQEGGLNDYVHMRRKPITKPFTLEIERYCGTDFVDPFPLGADLALPLLLTVNRTVSHGSLGPVNFSVPGRTYVFTGCTVMKKTFGELNGAQSGLLTDTITLAYRELLVVTTPMLGAISDGVMGSPDYRGTWSSKHGDDYKAKYDAYKTAKDARDAEEKGWKKSGEEFAGDAKKKAEAEKAAREKKQKELEAAAQLNAKALEAERLKKEKAFKEEEERRKKEEEARAEAKPNEQFTDDAKKKAEAEKTTREAQQKEREAAAQLNAKALEAEHLKKEKAFKEEEERRKKAEEAHAASGSNERFADEAKLAADSHKKTEAADAKAREAAAQNMTGFKDKMTAQAEAFKAESDRIEEERRQKEAEIAEAIGDEQKAAEAYMEALREFEAARDALEEANKAAMDKITEDYNEEAAKIESDRTTAMDGIKKETEEARQALDEKYKQDEEEDETGEETDESGETPEDGEESGEEPSGGMTDADAP